MRTAIINGLLLVEGGTRGGLLLEDGRILQVFHGEFTGEADTVYDAGGLYISPGFIDIHVHGGGGHDFMDGTVDAFIGAATAHLAHGTTSLVPTTLTCPDEELTQAFACFRQAKKVLEAPNLLGLHLEGPYFSASQAGAQDPRYLRMPDPAHYEPILEASRDIVRVSAAVELPGALTLGDALKQRGILGSIGHSDGFYPDVEKARRHGFTHVTHLYSGMSMLRRVGPYRHLGIVESAYLLDDVSVEIIADGKHLPPELLRLIVKCKPIDQICLVTDAMRGAGLPDGTVVKLGSLKNGQDCILEDGVAMMMDHLSFAGSACTADRCVRTMCDAGVSLTNAVRMMTEVPARVIGAKGKGTLAAGMDADLCVFDGGINIKAVFVGGKQVLGEVG